MGNYFQLLNLEPVFELDLAALESAYFNAQRQFHPDRFISKSSTERAAAMQRSIDVNQAYNTLKNPLSRAQYLLQFQGIKVGTEKDNIKPSQALLTEVMEWREQETPPDLAQVEQESVDSIASLYKKQDWQTMALETLRLGYIIKTRADQ